MSPRPGSYAGTKSGPVPTSGEVVLHQHLPARGPANITCSPTQTHREQALSPQPLLFYREAGMCCKLPSQVLPASRCESPTNRQGQALMGLNTLANMLSASEGPCHSHEPRWRAVCYHGLSTTTQVPTKACALGY